MPQFNFKRATFIESKSFDALLRNGTKLSVCK